MHNLSLRQAVFISSFIGKKNHLSEGHHSPCCQPGGEEPNNKRKGPNKFWVCNNFINFRITGLFFPFLFFSLFSFFFYLNVWKIPIFEQTVLEQVEPTPWLIYLCLELASMPLTLSISLSVKPECQQLGSWFMLGSPERVSDRTSFGRLPSHSKGSIKNKWNTFLWISGSWVCYGLGREAFTWRREMPLAPAQTGQACMS